MNRAGTLAVLPASLHSSLLVEAVPHHYSDSIRTPFRALSDKVPIHIGHHSAVALKLSDISQELCPI